VSKSLNTVRMYAGVSLPLMVNEVSVYFKNDHYANRNTKPPATASALRLEFFKYLTSR
jgi:hypothetical protein